MAGHQHQLVTQRKRGGIGRGQRTVLVGGFHVAQVGPLPHGGHARVHAGGLEARVDDGTLGRGAAHDGGAHEQGVLERDVVLATLVVAVVAIHEDVGAGLDFVEDAGVALVQEAAGARPRHALDGDAAGLDGCAGHARGFCGGGNGRGAVLRRAQVLGRPVIAVQAHEAQRCTGRDLLRKPHRLFAGGNATSVGPDVDLDIHIQRHVLSLRYGNQRLHLLRVIDQHAHACAAGQCGQAAQLGFAHHLVGDQHVGDAGFDEHGRLADLLAADAGRAQGDLAQGNFRRLVTLGMGAQAHAAAAQCLGHAREVAPEGIEVEHERGGVDGVEAIAGPCGFPGSHGELAFNRSSRPSP